MRMRPCTHTDRWTQAPAHKQTHSTRTHTGDWTASATALLEDLRHVQAAYALCRTFSMLAFFIHHRRDAKHVCQYVRMMVFGGSSRSCALAAVYKVQTGVEADLLLDDALASTHGHLGCSVLCITYPVEQDLSFYVNLVAPAFRLLPCRQIDGK